MTQKELVAALAQRQGISKYTANNAVNNIAKLIGEELKNGGEINIRGFGKFKTTRQRGLKRYDKDADEMVRSKAFEKISFKAALELKKYINGKCDTYEKRV